MNKEQLKEIRTKLGLTQDKFAELIGTTVVSVSRWENGRAKPSIAYIREIERLLKNKLPLE